MNEKSGFFFLEIAISLFVLLFLSGALIQLFVSNATLYKQTKLRQKALQIAIQQVEECLKDKDSFFRTQEDKNYRIFFDELNISSNWKKITVQWEPEQEVSLFTLSSIV